MNTTGTKRMPGIGDLLRAALGGWLAAALFAWICLPPELRNPAERDFLAALDPSRFVSAFVLVTTAFLVASVWRRAVPALRWITVGLFAALLGSVLMQGSHSLPLVIGSVILLALFVGWALWGWQGGEEALPTPAGRAHPIMLTMMAALSLLFFLFLCAWGVSRVVGLATPTYDMGIFSQMFHSMKESGRMMTTLEREDMLSHMAVHVSPIWYLLLPAYCLFPHPATLPVLQALILTSAVIPLWLLCDHHGLRGWERVLMCTLLLLYPALGGGVYYDIHENCFLTPLLLWLLLGIDKKSLALTASAAVLTLCVKEDAAVYVAVIGLWLLMRGLLRRGRWHALVGAALLAVALCWFALVTGYLAERGDGVMTWRYAPFMRPTERSLWEIVRTAVLAPGKLLFGSLQADRQRYLLMTLLPLLGLPLLTRRYERLVLLLPYLLVNLMPDYSYQHDIFFQYSFGSLALLFYLAVCNLGDVRCRRVKWLCPGALVLAVVTCSACFAGAVLPTAGYYIDACVSGREQDAQVRQVLAQIPDGAPAAATTFYTTSLSRREVLYDVGYVDLSRLLRTEYIALQVDLADDFKRYAKGGRDGFPILLQILHQHGYRVIGRVDNVMVLLYRPLPPS